MDHSTSFHSKAMLLDQCFQNQRSLQLCTALAVYKFPSTKDVHHFTANSSYNLGNGLNVSVLLQEFLTAHKKLPAGMGG